MLWRSQAAGVALPGPEQGEAEGAQQTGLAGAERAALWGLLLHCIDGDTEARL